MRRALAFLTPVGGAATPAPSALPWFPVVGALVGLVVGGVWWGARQVWPAAVAAVLALVADAVCTGGLHLDGLADSADGLLAPLPRARRLDVMADPAVGAFGVVTVVLVLLLRFAALSTARPAPLVVGGLWAGSRGAAAVVAGTRPYVRPGGLATAFRGGPWLLAGAVGLALAVGLAAAGGHLMTVAGEAVGAALVLVLAERRLGGFTGDVLGAAIVVGETAGLLVLRLHW